MTQWSVNPLAEGQGRGVSWLSYDPDTSAIFSGFGDWGANGDRVGIVSHSVPDGAVSVLFEPVASEAIGPVKRLQGHLYAPHIDPNTGYWSSEGGYASDESGQWADHSLPGQAEHVFDMAETSAGLWACGSAVHPDQATIGPALWHRPNGGEWRVEYREPIPAGADTSVRYYRIDVRDDRAVVQADGQVSGWEPVLRTFDGLGRVDAAAEPIGWGYNPRPSIEVGGTRYSAGALGVVESAPVAGDSETPPLPPGKDEAAESEDDMAESADDQIVGVDLHGRVDLSRFVTEAEMGGAGGADPGALHAATCIQRSEMPVSISPAEGTAGTARATLIVLRRGVTVELTLRITFDEPGTGVWSLGPVDEGVPLIPVRVAHNSSAFTADNTKFSIDTDLFASGYTRYWVELSLAGASSPVAIYNETATFITYDPAPPHSY